MSTRLATDDLRLLTTEDDVVVIAAVGDGAAGAVVTMAPAAPAAGAYALQVGALLPPGIAWPTGATSVLGRLTAAFATGLARVEARAQALLDEADPLATWEMLPDWEREVGLPDPCVAGAQTAIERRRALVTRLTYRGGQSIGFLTGLAAALGYTIVIDEHRPWRVGESSVAEPLNGAAWAFRLTVHAPPTTITSEWSVGRSPVTDPLRSWGNAALECAIRRAAPAQAVVRFVYDLEPA